MNKLLKSTLIAGLAFIGAQSAIATEGNFVISARLPQINEGTVVSLMDYDTGERLDSVQVTTGNATFKGSLDVPKIVRLTSKNDRLGTFIIEPNVEVIIEEGVAKGGELNARMDEFESKVNSLEAAFKNAPTDEQKQSILDQYSNLVSKTMTDNIENPVGYYLFLQEANDMEPAEVNQLLEKYPDMKKYKRVQDLIDFFAVQDNTAAGKKFTDFTITNEDGTNSSLSDYVGKSKLLIVDMWASWCSPCRKESVVLKELYKKYHDKGLEILGVAVWDELDDTKDAIKQLELTWPQIMNAQKVPTDLYGVMGIPFVMVIDQDGTIAARNIRGEELVKFVEERLN